MKTVDELKAYLAELPEDPKNFKIAVASLIFTPEDKIILLERGPHARDSVGKLEGVGGSIDDDMNLHDALIREIKEEIGEVKVKIEDMLTVLIRPSSNDPNLKWVVIAYLCRLVSGQPKNMEPHKCTAIYEISLDELPIEKLSKYQYQIMEAYKKKYGDRPYYKN